MNGGGGGGGGGACAEDQNPARRSAQPPTHFLQFRTFCGFSCILSQQIQGNDNYRNT